VLVGEARDEQAIVGSECKIVQSSRRTSDDAAAAEIGIEAHDLARNRIEHMQVPLMVALDGAGAVEATRDNFERAAIDVDANDIAYELAGPVKTPVGTPVHAVQAAGGSRK
jgi:hypothetical protein